MIRKIVIEKIDGKFKIDIINHNKEVDERSSINSKTLKDIVKVLETKKKKSSFFGSNRMFQDSRNEKSNYRNLTKYISEDQV